MEKLSYLRTNGQNMRNWLKWTNSARPAKYEDKMLAQGKKALPFKQSWALMAHMHDLRVWTIAYAPSDRNNLQRM
jgi:hypothetical protein